MDYLQTILPILQTVPSTYAYGGNVGPQAALLNQTIRAKEANTLSNQLISSKSNSINKTAEQIKANRALYADYLNKALNYNNINLTDLNADASAISGGIRRDLDNTIGILEGLTDNDFKAAFRNTIPDALMAAHAYIRNIGPNGQYQTESPSGSTTSWDSLINSPREEQLKSYFAKYGGTQGFGVDEGEDSTELSTIRHDYESFTERLLPQLRKAFNISDANQARNIAGYMALQLLHQGTERNSALGGYFQDPYDYHHAAAERAFEKLTAALENPDVLAVMDKMVRTNTALNEFEAANKAYNDIVTARNAREAQLQSRYGSSRNAGQRLVSMLTDQALDSAINARKGLVDTINTIDKLQGR